MGKSPSPHVNANVYEISRFLWGIFFKYYTGYKVEGSENIPAHGPLIVVSNHVSNLDIFAVGYAFKPYVTYPGKREAFENPRYGIYLRAMGGFPLDRDILDLKTAKLLIELLREGKIIGVMPEGTRSINGEISPFKPGFVKLAIITRTPILPIAILGTEKVLPKWSWIPKRTQVTLRAAPRIELVEFYGKKPNESKIEEISDQIRELLVELSKNKPISSTLR